MQAYRTGQEDQLGALGLVLNAAVFWTTRYLDAAVDHLRALPPEEREHDVLDEDVARLSALKHANLDCLGRYSFAARPRRVRSRSLDALRNWGHDTTNLETADDIAVRNQHVHDGRWAGGCMDEPPF